MSLVHVKTTIDAPVQRVWDTVMNPRQLERWVTIHRAIRNVPDEPLRNGATMEQVLHFRGVNFQVHWTLVDINAPNHAEWDGRGPAHSRAKIRYELTASGASGSGTVRGYGYTWEVVQNNLNSVSASTVNDVQGAQGTLPRQGAWRRIEPGEVADAQRPRAPPNFSSSWTK